jgi:hypothetical protein
VLGGRRLQGDHRDADPDHSTVAEFRRRHEAQIAELFDEVLELCREAGLVSVGLITIDGTKLKANASRDQNRSYAGVVGEILREAEEIDRREDELYGDSHGDELPEALRTLESRTAALADAKRRIQGASSARSTMGRWPRCTWISRPRCWRGRCCGAGPA